MFLTNHTKTYIYNEKGLTFIMNPTFENMVNEINVQSQYQLLLGYDESKQIRIHDLYKNGHLLMGGIIGSGKDVLMSEMILSLMMQHTPETLRLSIYDPKLVSFIDFESSPFVDHRITDKTDMIRHIDDLYDDFKNRQKFLFKHKYDNAHEYNTYAKNNDLIPLSLRTVFITEYFDLYEGIQEQNNDETLTRLKNLLQSGQNVGIYFVIGTSVLHANVIGELKEYVPSRVGLKTYDAKDSCEIIDQPGAEKLPGYGRILYRTFASSKLKEIQGAFAPDDDTKVIINEFFET